MSGLLLRRRSLIAASGGSAPLLPSEYQQVEWIEGTGTQKLKSSIVVASNTPANYHAAVEFSIPAATKSSPELIFGFSNIGGFSVYRIKNTTTVGLASASYIAVNTETKILAEAEWKSASTEPKGQTLRIGQQSCSNSVYSNTTTKTRFGWFYPAHVLSATSFTNARLKLYSSKLWYLDELVSDCYPCYRKSDNEIGLYDLVTEEFYTNYGTGTFNKGPDVN